MFFTIQPLDWGAVTIVLILLIPICIIDIKHFIIPDNLVFSGIAVLFAYLTLFDYQRLLPAVVHGAGAFCIILAFWFIFKKQIGLGDAKLSFFLAAGLGFLEWWGVLFIASLIAMTYGLIRVKMKSMTLKDKLPLAPFFGIGTVCVLLLKFIVLSLKL